jgi:hypothetical protein
MYYQYVSYDEGVIGVLRQVSNFLCTLWREQITFLRDDDEVHVALFKHA